MKKINRRDYLKHMGIAAAGTLGAAELNLFDSTYGTNSGNRDERVRTTDTSRMPDVPASPPASKPDWPWTDDATNLQKPNIRLVFAGMVCFTYKKKEGRAVFHRDDTHHNMEVIVYDRNGCREIFHDRGLPKTTKMDIRIKDKSNDDKSSDAKFFRAPDFKREDLKGHANDFRWLLDLENPPFSDIKFDRKEDKFSTKLKVRHGTFYTYKHTGSTFLNENTGMKLGYLPKVMATDIKLEPGECLSFKINGKEVLPPKTCSDAKLEIFFLNECADDTCKKGDFDMTFEALENPKKFTIKVDTKDPNGPTSDLCKAVPSSTRGVPHDRDKADRLNDEAPCMGGGFGGGGGFP
jgi:hypothetical protein